MLFTSGVITVLGMPTNAGERILTETSMTEC